MYDKSFILKGNIKSIFKDTWLILRPHIGYMTLIWAVFYIPTNVFILLRSGDMIKHLNSGSSLVIPVMLLLSLLGTIPNIALVLLVKNKDCEDYNSLVSSAFKKIPYYITTSFAMAISMIPMVAGGIIVSLILSFIMETSGITAQQQIYIIIPFIVLAACYAMLRYASAVPFYLMTGARNFRAARYSLKLFKMNRKIILLAFLICSLLPGALNFILLYAVESEALNVAIGFAIGYYLFLSTAFYAGLFNHFQEAEDEEIENEKIENEKAEDIKTIESVRED